MNNWRLLIKVPGTENKWALAAANVPLPSVVATMRKISAAMPHVTARISNVSTKL